MFVLMVAYRLSIARPVSGRQDSIPSLHAVRRVLFALARDAYAITCSFSYPKCLRSHRRYPNRNTSTVIPSSIPMMKPLLS